MLRIYTNGYEEQLTELDEKVVKKAVERAIAAIKNELPEEAHTVETFEYITNAIKSKINESKVLL